MIAVILDRQPDYLRGADLPLSLLTLPLGSSSVLDQLLARIINRVEGQVLVFPSFAPQPGYAERVQANSAFEVKVIDAEELANLSRDTEPSDVLLITDPSCWPISGFDVKEILGRHRDYRGATHAVAVGQDADRTRERVECDDCGQVKRIQRLFNLVTWPEAAESGLFLSLVPAQAIGEIRFQSLPELRAALVERGVLTQDDPIASDVIDLSYEEGFLALHDRVAASAVRPDASLGFMTREPEVLIGQDVQIDASARLTGPLIVYPGTFVGAGVTLIGPTVIGSQSKVQRGATVAQSVLAAGTLVPPGVILRHRVAAGTCKDTSTEGDPRRGSIQVPLAPIGGYHAADDHHNLGVEATTGRHAVHLALKRTLDVVIAALALVLLSPLLILIAILIKLDSRGPVFFGHRREQKRGIEFACFKFRTMVPGADRLQRALAEKNEVDGPQFKMENDPRVTRIGRILRATNLDELPQLFNVLVGEMSLVGPRPSPFRENQICVPWRRARLSVRPGITGLWQVCRANREQGDFNQWIYYDITYVRNLSVWLDLKILLATILTLGGKWSVPLSWIVQMKGNQGRNASAALAA